MSRNLQSSSASRRPHSCRLSRSGRHVDAREHVCIARKGTSCGRVQVRHLVALQYVAMIEFPQLLSAYQPRGASCWPLARASGPLELVNCWLASPPPARKPPLQSRRQAGGPRRPTGRISAAGPAKSTGLQPPPGTAVGGDTRSGPAARPPRPRPRCDSPRRDSRSGFADFLAKPERLRRARRPASRLRRQWLPVRPYWRPWRCGRPRPARLAGGGVQPMATPSRRVAAAAACGHPSRASTAHVEPARRHRPAA